MVITLARVTEGVIFKMLDALAHRGFIQMKGVCLFEHVELNLKVDKPSRKHQQIL